MKKLTQTQKKWIKQAVLIVSVLVATTAISFLVLSLCNILHFDGGLAFNTELFISFRDAWYGWIFMIFFQIALTILLCVLPGVSMAFIVLCTAIYSEPWEAFLICFISVMIASFVMYLIGRFGGYKVCVKLLGEEDCEKAIQLLDVKSKVYFPLMMLFPAFPDEALTMLAGTLKMKLSWFAPAVIIGRGIGIFSIVYGISLVPFEEFTSLYDWLVFITVCAFWLIIIFYLANKLDKKLESKKADQLNKE